MFSFLSLDTLLIAQNEPRQIFIGDPNARSERFPDSRAEHILGGLAHDQGDAIIPAAVPDPLRSILG
mgnify:CR=1 FL=1